MKNLLKLVGLVSVLFFTVAQTPIQPDATRVRNVLLKTNRLIGLTHMAVKNGKVYTGKLGKAVQFERFAKKLYLAKEYKKAAQYSIRAREFAIEALTANKAKPTSDGTITEDEKLITNPLPEISTMEEELTKESIALPTDEDLVANGNLDITI
ncbi:MAG: hypothetical protein U0U66_09080 [Cytophagaceae bacterium]